METDEVHISTALFNSSICHVRIVNRGIISKISLACRILVDYKFSSYNKVCEKFYHLAHRKRTSDTYCTFVDFSCNS